MKPLSCILIVLLVSVMWSCRTQKVVVAEKETTTITVHEREIPVFTPEIDVNAQGKIWIDPSGKLKLGDIKVTTNSDKPQPKQPKVNVELDSLGNLNVDVVIPEDTTHVVANDSTIQTNHEKNNYIEVEKENPWWKKALMFAGIIFIIVIFVNVRKHKIM